jgi:hypothetical protein
MPAGGNAENPLGIHNNEVLDHEVLGNVCPQRRLSPAGFLNSKSASKS